ncbi:hypothetical protein HYD56_02360 [Mycoplasmopsis bovis]|nr:hypothetical protein [Mycoplasmopsis bovis]QQH66618.1 hypothetical protein HYD56_02360 [Mycoplasmopsis bovis]
MQWLIMLIKVSDGHNVYYKITLQNTEKTKVKLDIKKYGNGNSMITGTNEFVIWCSILIWN